MTAASQLTFYFPIFQHQPFRHHILVITLGDFELNFSASTKHRVNEIPIQFMYSFILLFGLHCGVSTMARGVTQKRCLIHTTLKCYDLVEFGSLIRLGKCPAIQDDLYSEISTFRYQTKKKYK